MKIKFDIYENMPLGSADLWAPPKSEENARVIFPDRPDRIADIIFFSNYPKCLRIRLYGPAIHIVCDLFADAAFQQTNAFIPGFWDELVVDTLRRGSIIPQGETTKE